MAVKLVAAVADNGVIGADGAIPWHLRDDFAHFKRETAGHALVMGRATYESLPRRPLPGRPNIVLTRGEVAEGDAQVARSLAHALELAQAHGPDIAVIGGASVYAEALPVGDVQVLTEVHLSPDGDTYYPAYRPEEWREIRRERQHEAGVDYDWVWLERVR